jgi:DNA-binding CsgD family transcriptional regulator/tetratricopeptide (TPR) repeat protein
VSQARPRRRSTAWPLAEAQQALRRGAWEQARRHFDEALADEEVPEALEGLGAAAWWLEEAPTVFASRERAYRLYQERQDRRAAGRLATQLGYDYAVFRAELAVSNGWLQRAHRLLDALEPGPEQVVLALTEAELAYQGDGDLEAIRVLALRAQELAGQLGVFDLQMVGLAVEGLALVALGAVSDGMRRLDEATAAAVAGDIQDFQAVAATLCIMIFACERVQDVDRAGQWCDRYMAFCLRNGLRAQLALCRVQYASVLTARGRWAEAESQLAQALDGLRARAGWSLPAQERLGELRRRQGRLDEAEQHFACAHPAGSLGQARLALERGDYDRALDLVGRLLRRLPGRGPLERTAPLELLIQVHCECGRVRDAEAALKDLENSVASACTVSLQALVSQSRGRVALAAGDALAAQAHFEDALDLYEGGQLPFEAAQTRLELAGALYDLGRQHSALDQVQAARETFQRLGSGALASRAESLAEELAGPGQTVLGESSLSPRETEVLALVARGLSNDQIAAELVLSKHTVRRHVSNILTKLGLPSRTAAAVYALERQRA